MNRTRLALALLVMMMAAAPARAGFDDVVHALESRHHLHRTWIPFLGLARAACWVAKPEGVHDFRLAVFDEQSLDADASITALVRDAAGGTFRPLVETRSRHNREWTVILAQPLAGGLVRLLIVSHDSGDTTLVQTDVDADHVAAAVKRNR